MDTMLAPRILPGRPASSSLRFMSRLWAVFAVVFSGEAVLSGYLAGIQGGRLTSPLLELAFATPAGALILVVIGMILVFPAILLAQRIGFGQPLARVVDVTEVPLDAWPRHAPGWAERTRVERWLGPSRRAQAVNLVILILAALLTLPIVGAFIAVQIYVHTPECTATRCPPDYPVSTIVLTSMYVALSLMFWAQYRKTRRIEAECGIWLRDRDGKGSHAPQFYLRRPGVTSEQATLALARFRPQRDLTSAEVYGVVVLTFAWIVLLEYAAGELAIWLQTQWIPG